MTVESTRGIDPYRTEAELVSIGCVQTEARAQQGPQPLKAMLIFSAILLDLCQNCQRCNYGHSRSSPHLQSQGYACAVLWSSVVASLSRSLLRQTVRSNRATGMLGESSPLLVSVPSATSDGPAMRSGRAAHRLSLSDQACKHMTRSSGTTCDCRPQDAPLSMCICCRSHRLLWGPCQWM